MQSTIGPVIHVRLQAASDMLVPVGEAYVLDHDVLTVLLCQAVGHPEPERQ